VGVRVVVVVAVMAMTVLGSHRFSLALVRVSEWENLLGSPLALRWRLAAF
jgi:hypothetical protein